MFSSRKYWRPRREKEIGLCPVAAYQNEQGRLAFAIARVMFVEDRSVESFNAFHSIRNYFLYLSMDDLISIASQYGIKYH